MCQRHNKLSGCREKVLAVIQVCEKKFVNGNDVFLVFMDLKSGYDSLDRLEI